MSTAEQRQEWARLAEAATPGEWEIRNHGSAGSAIVTGEYERVFTVARTFEHENAAFIAASRTAVPALLADVDRLTAERDAAYRLLEGLTPGGSEFYDSPQNCAEWAMDRMRNVMEQVKARKAAEAERDELAGQLAEDRRSAATKLAQADAQHNALLAILAEGAKNLKAAEAERDDYREGRDQAEKNLADALDEVAGYKRNANYISSVIDSDGCYRP
jgi:hypothetical protein